MGNPFMPSVATSLNQAGGMTLQSLLEQRLVQQEMAAQQQKLQQQALMDQMSLGLRLRGDQRAALNDAERVRQFEVTQGRLKEKEAFERRQKNNERGVALMAAQMPDDTPHLARRQMAIEAGVAPSAFDAPKKERTLADKVAETEALTAARERTKAKFPKPTKVAKDNPKLPAGVKAAIDAKRGQPGWEDARSAAKSLMRSWPSIRSAHPEIDQGEAHTYIANLFGERLTPTMVDGSSESSHGDLATRVRAKMGLPPK